jgi:hypothetical protein
MPMAMERGLEKREEEESPLHQLQRLVQKRAHENQQNNSCGSSCGVI